MRTCRRWWPTSTRWGDGRAARLWGTGVLQALMRVGGLQKYGERVVHLSKKLCLRSSKMARIPLCLRRFEHLEELDVSDNSIVRLPGLLFTKGLLRLRVLDASFNRIAELDQVLGLRPCLRLESLDLSSNPLPLVSQFHSLLLALLCGGVSPLSRLARPMLFPHSF